MKIDVKRSRGYIVPQKNSFTNLFEIELPKSFYKALFCIASSSDLRKYSCVCKQWNEWINEKKENEKNTIKKIHEISIQEFESS